MRHRGYLLMAVFTLFLGFTAPAWAATTADPLEESYYSHVLPFFKIDAGWQTFAIFSDTSYNDPNIGCSPGRDTHCAATIHMYFFNQDCQLVRDATTGFTANDVTVVALNNLTGLPNEGVILADTGLFQASTTASIASGFQRFLAYILLLNPLDNTLTRIDSIPFAPFLEHGTSGTFHPIGSPATIGGFDPATVLTSGHWTRYDPINTVALTVGDSTLAGIGEIRTTLMLFNALGGGVTGSPNFAPTPHGAIDTLREFMIQYGRPRSPFGITGGDWVTTGSSTTADVTPGIVELDAYDGDENFLGSFRILPRCFERVRLGTLIPALATPPPPAARAFLGHIVSFALPNVERKSASSCGSVEPSMDGRCSFSGFQETVVEGGAVDLIFSGYMHHSSGPRQTAPQP